MKEIDTPIAIIGAGFAGSLLALRLAAAGLRPVLIDPGNRPGEGLAYGAAEPQHLLNVPAVRMEVGLTPSFLEWARACTEPPVPDTAFLPRRQFGAYLVERVAEAIADGKIRQMRSCAVGLEPSGSKSRVVLQDGRGCVADRVVLALGNFAPAAPRISDDKGNYLQDVAGFISDPWAPAALDDVAAHDDVLLIGTGLTAIDIYIWLRDRGHRGRIVALSRHGLLPLSHRNGGEWPAFLAEYAGRSPFDILRVLRVQAQLASDLDIPWQRVMDAARPAVAKIWRGWSQSQRRQFLRHGRAIWDIHRHRLAPVLDARLQKALSDRGLVTHAGRLTGFSTSPDGLSVRFRPRHRRSEDKIAVTKVINCTGPASDLASLNLPLLSDLRRQGVLRSDPLGLGADTRRGRLVSREGQISETLFALGALTRPAWWEITAVPEITRQVDRLALQLTAALEGDAEAELERDFMDIGAGI